MPPWWIGDTVFNTAILARWNRIASGQRAPSFLATPFGLDVSRWPLNTVASRRKGRVLERTFQPFSKVS